MNVQFEEIDGLRIRYASQLAGHPENVLLLSPLPESVLAFSPIWNALAERFNLLAIDLPGFGHSEGRPDLYTTQTIAAFVSQAIDHFAFTRPHLVGPDIGTPVALFVAAKFPQKITSLIVSGGACVYPLQVAGFLKDLLAAPDLSGYNNVSVSVLVNGSLSELKNYTLPDAIRADYISSYEGENRLMGALQLLRSYIGDLPILDTYLDTLLTPVKIIWGQHDPVAPVQNAQILQERLPKNDLTILDDGIHYLWEDQSAVYQDLIINWINGGYATLR